MNGSNLAHLDQYDELLRELTDRNQDIYRVMRDVGDKGLTSHAAVAKAMSQLRQTAEKTNKLLAEVSDQVATCRNQYHQYTRAVLEDVSLQYQTDPALGDRGVPLAQTPADLDNITQMVMAGGPAE